jgi:DegV family protein with EDD domain
MPTVAVVTDSSACLPADLLAVHRITTVPLSFEFDGAVHRDGSLSSGDFFALLRSARRFPTTSSPAPAEFLEAYREASHAADAVLCATLPAAFSGTYASALAAAELAAGQLPGLTVRVVDTHCLAMCHGFAVLAAAHAARAGAGLEAVEATLRAVAQRAYLIGALDSLRYLAKSGRVPAIVHWAASLLQIKPIRVAEGERVRAAGRTRTMPRALDRLQRLIEERYDGARPLHLAVMHADAPAAAERLAAALRERLRPDELLVTEFTSVMGAHTGPGFVGAAFYSGDASATAVSLAEDILRMEAAIGEPPPPQPRPLLVLVSGLPGSGKSHFSRELCRRLPLAHLNNDALRRALFDRPTHDAAESERLFAAIHVLLERLLARNVGVVLDATNLKEAYRRPLYDIAERAGVRLIIVQTEAPPDVARERLRARTSAPSADLDASDATEAVYNRMKEGAEPIQRPYIRVDTSGDIEPALAQVVEQAAVDRE